MAATALDMSLDDVIKTKGKRGRGGAAQQAKPRTRSGAAKAAPKKAAREAEKLPVGTREAAGARRIGGRALAAAVASSNAITPAAKAAAAAAKATATAASPAGKAPSFAAAARALQSKKAEAKAKAKGASSVSTIKATKDKLEMSLEDMIKVQGAGKARKTAEAGVPDGEKLRSGAGGGSRRGGRKRRGMMKLRAEEKATKAQSPKAKAKAKAKGRARAALEDEWFFGGKGKGKDGKGKMAGWGGGKDMWRRGDDLGRRRPLVGGMYADWDMGGKRRAADDWGLEMGGGKRARIGYDDPPRNSFGWGRGGIDDGWGPSRLADRRGLGGLADDRAGRLTNRQARGVRAWSPPPSRRVLGGAGRSRAAMDALPKFERPKNVSCSIRVSNVPKNLDWRDIKEAFEDNGRVTRCQVEKGVAWVTFESAMDAKKAVQTFDRGELNGQTIFVTYET